MFASKSIMIVGTSMVQRAYSMKHMGFGIGLSDWYSRLADIFLRGQSGYNSRWILASLPELIGPQRPDLVILFLGNNDSVTNKGVQSVPVEEFRSNLAVIMKTFRSVNPDVTFLLLTPTRATKVGRIDSVTEKYVLAVREMGELDHRTAVVELWDGDNAIIVTDLCDGLHLNAFGNQKVLLGIKAAIRSRFHEFLPFNDRELPSSFNDQENIENQKVSDDDANIIERKAPQKQKRLQWLFPPWKELMGKSKEESSRVINLARMRSFL